MFDSAPAWWWVTLMFAAVAGLVGFSWWWLQRRLAHRRASAAEAVDTLLGWSPHATRVLTPAELLAYRALTQALPQHVILAQVSLARFIKVPTRNSYAEWLRRVGHLSADLVVCDLQSQVVAVVEVRPLRERGGERAGRRQERFARVLKAVGIPLHVWVENAIPGADEVRRTVTPKPTPAAAVPTAATAPDTVALPPPTQAEAGFEVTQYPPADEVIEMREPPSSTWFDEFDSSAAPLDPPRKRLP